jgi:hypothetical protein
MCSPLIPIEKWTEKRAIISAVLNGILKKVGSAVSAGWAELQREFHAGCGGTLTQRHRGTERAGEDRPRMNADNTDLRRCVGLDGQRLRGKAVQGGPRWASGGDEVFGRGAVVKGPMSFCASVRSEPDRTTLGTEGHAARGVFRGQRLECRNAPASVHDPRFAG